MKRKEFYTIQETIEEQMQRVHLAPALIKEFLRRVEKVHSERAREEKAPKGLQGKVDWAEIGDLKTKDVVSLEDLELSSEGQKYLHFLAIIKLNGGLGTSMGLSKAKSLIPIKEKQNFLELICQQIQAARQKYKAPILALFMNSFNTQKDCLETPAAATLNQDVAVDFPTDFLQNQVPRLYEDSLLPLEEEELGQQAWHPPGHGDVFFALKSSGLLERLIDLGYHTAFISNGDNLGALIEPRILEYFHKEKLEWISEITLKTAADLKGGTFFRSKSQDKPDMIELLEIAQVPEKHIKDFQDTKRFKYFNVNNLWVDLKALDKKLKENSLELALILNPKKIAGRKALQLESAMGSAISCFAKSRVVLVPRKRFSPVKSCADLLVRRSDAYVLDPQSHALLPRDEKKIPLAVLSKEYKELENFEKLFPQIPSLKDALRLELEGPLCFDRPVKITGRVRFQVQGKEQRAVSELNRKEFKDEDVLL